MSEFPWIQYKGNRQPPYSFQITIEGRPPPDVIPAGATVKMQMRSVTSSTLKIDALATIDDAVNGLGHYDWAALDVDTAGTYVAWQRVTLAGGQFEDTPELPVIVLDHVPLGNQYVSVSEMKASLTLSGETYADGDIQRALEAAANVVDDMTRRSFGPAASSTQLFTPVSQFYLYIGNVTSITSVSVEGTAWVENTDYYLNGGDTLRVLGGKLFPRAARSVSVTAFYGYAAVPPEIKEATQIIATQLLRRAREAPFGVLATSLDGPAIRIGRFDPQVDACLSRYKRSMMVE